MYHANRVFHRLRFYVVLYDYDIWLRMLLKCITIYESLTQSNKSATIMLTLSGLQMKILNDEVWHSNFSNFIVLELFEISWTLQ